MWLIAEYEAVDEFFDLEAAAVGERLGLPWNNPARLWFYVFK